MLLLPDVLMRCCAAGKNGCLDLRRHSVDGWALSGAGIQGPWHGVLETVWLHYDRAQQVGCLPEDWRVVRWCRTQASSQNSQGVGVDEAGMRNATPKRHVVPCGWMHHGWVAIRRVCCSSSTPAGVSKPPQGYDAWCQLLAKWLDVCAIRRRPVQRYSEVFGLVAEGQGLVVVFDFKLALSFLVVEMEGCRHRFCSAEL